MSRALHCTLYKRVLTWRSKSRHLRTATKTKVKNDIRSCRESKRHSFQVQSCDIKSSAPGWTKKDIVPYILPGGGWPDLTMARKHFRCHLLVKKLMRNMVTDNQISRHLPYEFVEFRLHAFQAFKTTEVKIEQVFFIKFSNSSGKYTNPDKGILDFCRQKLTAPPMTPLRVDLQWASFLNIRLSMLNLTKWWDWPKS